MWWRIRKHLKSLRSRRLPKGFGDCFSYASAKAASLDLLYVGEDFALTDLA